MERVRDGLRPKYFVFKNEAGECGEMIQNCFVLRLDKKDPAARVALRAYALVTPNKDLEQDLLKLLEETK